MEEKRIECLMNMMLKIDIGYCHFYYFYSTSCILTVWY